MVQSLMHKFIVEDSTKCFTANPDYILIFKKKGENKVPVIHPFGLTHYAGEIPILPNMLRAYNNANKTNFTAEEMWDYLLKTKEEDKISKLNHYIWLDTLLISLSELEYVYKFANGGEYIAKSILSLSNVGITSIQSPL